MQTTIIKTADYLDKILEINCNKTRAFVVIICRNLAINIYNQRKRRNTVNIEDLENILHEESDISPEVHVLRLDRGIWLAGQLALIKPEYADILTLKYEYEYSTEEIASLLSITEVNVRARLARARQSLQKIIGDDNYEHQFNG